RNANQVGDAIKSGIATNFATEPTVFVTVQALRPVFPGSTASGDAISVFMMGEITSPGEKRLEPGTSLIQALASGGSFTPFAATKRIILRRTDANGRQTVSKIDYKAISRGAVAQDIRLRDGDVIIVPERRLFE
ncbi:MAG: polysaccharide export protein, partial [Pseudomonadota bacterium]